VSAQLGTVTRLPVHPASPVLLTKNGPLGALDSVNSHASSSYPEGNFGGNQLLDGSISLSPLYPSQTNDLHVSIAAGLHQSFLWLRPAQVGRRCTPRGGSRQSASLRLRVYSPVDSHTCQTPWSVFQDGSNGEPTGQHRERAVAEARREARAARHDRPDGGNPRWSTPRADWRTDSRRSASDRAHRRPHPLPSRQFQ
ncbi:OLC1v1018544C1, partial [Oldenlandia corymbosa var. corymbosa]